MSVPRLVSAQVRRLRRLLDMPYRPGEIAKELGITTDTFFRSFIPAGAPVMFDALGKTWVNGKAFQEWAKNYLASRHNQPRGKMAEDEGYCFSCRSVRKMKTPKRMAVRKQVDVISGRCEVCNSKMARMIRAVSNEADHVPASKPTVTSNKGA
jgi:hypothetical protein